MSDNPFPSTDPVVVAQWAGLIRTVIAALAGAGLLGATWAAVSVEQIINILTAVLTLVGVGGVAWSAIWSWRQKRAARAITVASAVASAEATVDAGRATPVTVTVTPVGQPNEAVRISTAEQRAAPSVPGGAKPSPAPVAA